MHSSSTEKPLQLHSHAWQPEEEGWNFWRLCVCRILWDATLLFGFISSRVVTDIFNLGSQRQFQLITRRDWSSAGDNTQPLFSIPSYSLDICRRSAGEEAIVLRCFSLWQDSINMTSPAKFRKDKEIIAEYETHVKGKWNMSHYSTANVTIVFLLDRLPCVCGSTSGANAS